jgi:hypothetical protein
MFPILFLSIFLLLRVATTILLFLVVGDTKAVTPIISVSFSNIKHKIPVMKIIIVVVVIIVILFLDDD